MERVPTQTDLIRLCDAADSLVEDYELHIKQFGSTVGRWDYELDQFANIIRLIPDPPHSFSPFGVNNVDWWYPRDERKTWSDDTFDAFVELASLVRNMHFHWLDVRGDATLKQRVREADEDDLGIFGPVKEAIAAIAKERTAITRRRWMIFPFEIRTPIAARWASHCSSRFLAISCRATRSVEPRELGPCIGNFGFLVELNQEPCVKVSANPDAHTSAAD